EGVELAFALDRASPDAKLGWAAHLDGIDLLEAARQLVATLAPLTAIVRQVAGGKTQGPLARLNDQRIASIEYLQELDVFQALHNARARDAHELVPLAFRQFRQFLEIEHQQAPFVADTDDKPLLDSTQQHGRQHAGAVRQPQQACAGLVLALQVLKTGDDAIARIGRDQAGVLGIADQQPLEAGTGGRAQAAGERFPLPARRGQAVRRQRMGPAGGVEEQGLLTALAARRLLQGVTRAVGEFVRLHIVSLGGAYPAGLREDDGNRLGTDQLGLTEGLGFRALHQRRSPIVPVVARGGAELLL